MQDVADEALTPVHVLGSGRVHENYPGDLVTVADHDAEDQITEALRAAYSEAVVLGEEAASAKSQPRRPVRRGLLRPTQELRPKPPRPRGSPTFRA